MKGKNDYKTLLLEITELTKEDVITNSGEGAPTFGAWNDGNDDTAKSSWN